MVEMMVTVVIVAVCLVTVVRVFAICSKAISDVINRSFAIDTLQEEFEKVRESSLINGGIEKNSFRKTVSRGNRSIQVRCEITPWTILITPEIPDAEDPSAASEPIKKMSGLCEVMISAIWETRGSADKLSLRTFLPEKTMSRSPSELTE